MRNKARVEGMLEGVAPHDPNVGEKIDRVVQYDSGTAKMERFVRYESRVGKKL